MHIHVPSPRRAAIAAAAAAALLCALIAAGAAFASSPPATVTAVRLAADKAPFRTAGSVVRAFRLGQRVFIGSKKGFALASVGGAQYPAATLNGGKTWRVDGPHLHVNAANAPDVVTSVGAVGPATYFAYAGPGGGQTVAVTTDGGKDWWRAFFPGVPLAVLFTHAIGNGALVSLVESGPAQFWTYVSTDGGKHWTYDKSKFV